MGFKKLSLEEFISFYSRVPRLCVDLIIKTDKGIILTKRSIEPWKGQWHLPGGTVYLGETLKQAVKRVAKDELNLDVEVIKNFGVMEFFHEKRGHNHAVSIVFLTKIKSGEIKLNEQAEKVVISKTIPENTILEHKLFLEKFNSNSL